MQILGIDFGGSGIKGALTDISTGQLTTERYRIETPIPATPEAVSKAIKEIIRFFNYSGPVGVGFPAAIINGTVMTASNIDKGWIGINAASFFQEKTGLNTYVLNDADAAGIAEMRYGYGKDFNGLAFFLTIGTGIGTALIYKGQLIPNTELGHIYMKNAVTGEEYTSDAVRERLNLKWKEFSIRFNKYLNYLYKLFYPELFIIGGGVSKKFDKVMPELTVPVKVLPALLKNSAGMIGAALMAGENL